MQWVMRYNPGAVAYIWQGGQEGCRGVLDVLNGTVTVSYTHLDVYKRQVPVLLC